MTKPAWFILALLLAGCERPAPQPTPTTVRIVAVEKSLHGWGLYRTRTTVEDVRTGRRAVWVGNFGDRGDEIPAQRWPDGRLQP